MKSEWMLDVLLDLAQVARANKQVNAAYVIADAHYRLALAFSEETSRKEHPSSNVVSLLKRSST